MDESLFYQKLKVKEEEVKLAWRRKNIVSFSDLTYEKDSWRKGGICWREDEKVIYYLASCSELVAVIGQDCDGMLLFVTGCLLCGSFVIITFWVSSLYVPFC